MLRWQVVVTVTLSLSDAAAIRPFRGQVSNLCRGRGAATLSHQVSFYNFRSLIDEEKKILYM